MLQAGDEVLVLWGGSAIAAQVNHDESWNSDQRNTSTKQSGKFQESLPARRSGDLSLTFLFDDNATLGYLEVFEDWKSGEVKELKASRQEVGDFELICDAWVSGMGRSHPDQDNQECTVDFTFTGEPNYTEITV